MSATVILRVFKCLKFMFVIKKEEQRGEGACLHVNECGRVLMIEKEKKSYYIYSKIHMYEYVCLKVNMYTY